MDSNESKGWVPRHKDTPTIDHAKVHSVSEARDYTRLITSPSKA